jgi:hypothetical protein
MGWILRALELYQSFVRSPGDGSACPPLENLPPSKVRDLLHKVLRETALGNACFQHLIFPFHLYTYKIIV